MDNPLAELEAWWETVYDDGGMGTRLDLFQYRLLLDVIEGDDDDKESESRLLEFETYDDAEKRASWRLNIDALINMAWYIPWGPGEPKWSSEHPLLVPHQGRGAWISFSTPFKDPLRAWGAAANAHRAIMGDWVPLERYFRVSMLAEEYAELARGPERLIVAYYEALRAIGENVGMGVHETHSGWDAHLPRPSLVTWGKSYFIARSFRLERTG